jgi:hypothetical protein
MIKKKYSRSSRMVIRDLFSLLHNKVIMMMQTQNISQPPGE